METAIEVYTRKLREGVTFVAPFEKAYIYAGMHDYDKMGYVVIMDHDKGTWILLQEPYQDAFDLAAGMMSMIDRGIVNDFVPSDDLKMDGIIPSLGFARRLS